MRMLLQIVGQPIHNFTLTKRDLVIFLPFRLFLSKLHCNLKLVAYEHSRSLVSRICFVKKRVFQLFAKFEQKNSQVSSKEAWFEVKLALTGKQLCQSKVN